MTFEESIIKIEQQAREFVWWSPSQIARGEDVINDPTKGSRAWSVPRKTAEFLHDFVMQNNPKVIWEFGTSIGYSTLWLAHAASETDSHVYTIELQKYKYDIAKQNIEESELSNFVTFYNAPIADVLKNLEFHAGGEKINLIFMDADRGHYHEYFAMVEPYLSDTATIIADNAIDMQVRMQPFLQVLKDKNWNYQILDFDNGVLVAQKKMNPPRKKLD